MSGFFASDGFLLDSEPDSVPPVAGVAGFLFPDLEEGLGAPVIFPAAEDGRAFEGVLLDPREIPGADGFLASSFLGRLRVESSVISSVKAGVIYVVFGVCDGGWR